MKTKVKKTRSSRLTLDVETAADLMQPNPISIRDRATIREATALLSDKGFSAAPVINAAGHPVGVVSRSDIVVHDRERTEYAAPLPDYYEDEEGRLQTAKFKGGGLQSAGSDPTVVSEIMTPVVFSVPPDAPVTRVVQEMISLRVHRLFVVDESGVLIGVISATDILRHLH